jgi:serine/threonine-protein phosphatase 2A regulatory subunit B
MPLSLYLSLSLSTHTHIYTHTHRPSDCNTLIYGSSRGVIRWADLRDNALQTHCAKQFEVPENPARKSFFSEIVASVGDCKFTPDGRYIVSRDYLSMKIWDVKMENRPLKVIPVHEYLRGFMVNLYEKDCVFDKFECAVSPDGKSFLSGSYNSHFVVHNSHTEETTTVRAMTQTYGSDGKLNDCVVDTPNVKVMDFAQKTTHTAWHPNSDILAVCCCNKLYVYDYASVIPRAINPL